MRELCRDPRLVRYDERGNGLSDWSAEDLSLAAFVADLEAVIDAAGLSGMRCSASPGLRDRDRACSSPSRARERPRPVRRVRAGVAGARRSPGARPGGGDAHARRPRDGAGPIPPSAALHVCSFPARPRADERVQRAAAQEHLTRECGTARARVRRPRRLHAAAAGAGAHARPPCARRPCRPLRAGSPARPVHPRSPVRAARERHHLLAEDEPAWQRIRAEVRDFLMSIGTDAPCQLPA